MDIRQISPLYNYWISQQTDEDERERLALGNTKSKAYYLYAEEPYKWENLFQSVSRELINGDHSSVRAMDILLSTLNDSQKKKILQVLENECLFKKSILEELNGLKPIPSFTSKKPLRFFKILFVIFTNPYGLVIKRKKNHIYEITGTITNKLVRRIARIFNF